MRELGEAQKALWEAMSELDHYMDELDMAFTNLRLIRRVVEETPLSMDSGDLLRLSRLAEDSQGAIERAQGWSDALGEGVGKLLRLVRREQVVISSLREEVT